ncbi:MAG: TIGR04452 family lipoprotein [Leptospiraceae bacterium]|nr:TIGR04452 family lipoprotein [Leptospiraceae bacterium]MCP5493282.1 TIGR04452 family lipoprotein [Leptospiraceae bacterium]
MKKNFILLFIGAFSIYSCVLIDTIGLSNPESVKGSEAKSKIVTNATIGAIAGGIDTDIVLAFTANRLAGVDETKYYDKIDVDNCANEALLINWITINMGGLTCDLREHKTIVDWPVPIL